MIERIVIENFKSLRSVDLTLGRVNLFVGTNASGKSNFLEALRVLEGIGNGFTIGEILNGKPRSATNEIWAGIRGGSKYACFSDSVVKDEIAIASSGRLEESSSMQWEYKIVFSSEKMEIIDEIIHMDDGFHYSRKDDNKIHEDPFLPFLSILTFRLFSPHKSLESIIEDTEWHKLFIHFFVKDKMLFLPPLILLPKLFSDMQFIALKPETLRSYSQSGSAPRMGNYGENFAALVKTICQDEELKDAYLSWLHHLRPEEVDDVGTLAGAVGEPLFMLRENGREFPAPVLSDGTLRFAALTAAFFQPDTPGIMVIEEIENGIHASRIQLLLELFRTQAETSKMQIFATTHSPAILDWLQEEDYKTTFLCTRDESTGESRIRSLADVPHFMDVIKKTPASELFSEGWFEAVS